MPNPAGLGADNRQCGGSKRPRTASKPVQKGGVCSAPPFWTGVEAIRGRVEHQETVLFTQAYTSHYFCLPRDRRDRRSTRQPRHAPRARRNDTMQHTKQTLTLGTIGPRVVREIRRPFRPRITQKIVPAIRHIVPLTRRAVHTGRGTTVTLQPSCERPFLSRHP